MTTYGLFWLGMEAVSKPGGGNPVGVRRWPFSPSSPVSGELPAAKGEWWVGGESRRAHGGKWGV